jgi:hypothetical protein
MKLKPKVTLSCWKFNAILRTMDYDECDALDTFVKALELLRIIRTEGGERVVMLGM